VSKYADIIERLEKATRANFQLERDIDAFCHFGSAGSLDRTPPPYTASVDAAIALVERMFSPGYYRLEKLKGLPDPHHACWATAGASGQQEDAYAPTAPLALLLALFRALEAKEAT